jgi:hypothetical protein
LSNYFKLLATLFKIHESVICVVWECWVYHRQIG